MIWHARLPKLFVCHSEVLASCNIVLKFPLGTRFLPHWLAMRIMRRLRKNLAVAIEGVFVISSLLDPLDLVGSQSIDIGNEALHGILLELRIRCPQSLQIKDFFVKGILQLCIPAVIIFFALEVFHAGSSSPLFNPPLLNSSCRVLRLARKRWNGYCMYSRSDAINLGQSDCHCMVGWINQVGP